MKILYIGDADNLAKVLIDQLSKENDEVFLTAPGDFIKKKKPIHPYKFYQSNVGIKLRDEVFFSINPDIVVWGGAHYLQSKWEGLNESYEYLSQLEYWLEKCAAEGKKRFIFLSTVHIYGLMEGMITEDYPHSPDTRKGMLISQGECMVDMYRKRYALRASILRCGDIYEYVYNPGDVHFLKELVDEVQSPGAFIQDELLQPVTVMDVADAVKRCVHMTRDTVYNICAAGVIHKTALVELLARQLSLECPQLGDAVETDMSISSQKAREELEWTNFKELDKLVEEEKIPFEKLKKREGLGIQVSREGKLSANILKTIENILLFLIFAALQYFSKDNALFAEIDWMIIYILSIGLFFGISQSFLAVVLSGIVYFLSQDLSIIEISNFYSFAGGVIQIAEYIFIGIVAAYVTDTLKEELRSKSADYELLDEEKEELSVISKENVLVKNEYEKRLLSTKNSLPKLYSIISKISVLQPDRIFMEVLNVIAEMLETDTVSVYMTKKGSPYLRLITSLNEKSIYKGKSWNLTDTQNIQEAIMAGRVFEGDRFKEEPVLVAPIMDNQVCIAVIVINDIPFARQTLYQVNLLRTLTVLISESVSKAIQYETMIRESRFYENTEILKQEEFSKILQIETEKQHQNIAQMCVLKCISKEPLSVISKRIESILRNTDRMGLDQNQQLCILLGNTARQEGLFVLERLKKINVDALVVDTADVLGESK